MPRVDPAEYEALPLHAFELVRGFPLHDVWRVELDGAADCSLPVLLDLIRSARAHRPNPLVRALFAFRSVLGRVFRLDSPAARRISAGLLEALPEKLAKASLVPPGTPEGAFQALYVLPTEAAYQARSATVDAILVMTLVASTSGHRFFWATYVKPAGRITPYYMGLIDPFRRTIVYPGLEAWLKREWAEASRPAR